MWQHSELQIRGGIEDNSKILLLVFQQKHMLWPLFRTVSNDGHKIIQRYFCLFPTKNMLWPLFRTISNYGSQNMLYGEIWLNIPKLSLLPLLIWSYEHVLYSRLSNAQQGWHSQRKMSGKWSWEKSGNFGKGQQILSFRSNPQFPNATVSTGKVKSKNIFWICKKGIEVCKMSGKIQGKLREFWSRWLATLLRRTLRLCIKIRSLQDA